MPDSTELFTFWQIFAGDFCGIFPAYILFIFFSFTYFNFFFEFKWVQYQAGIIFKKLKVFGFFES